MEGNTIYRDIATRTNGDIYVGVVGPVRTGKSTFIKKFMDLLVIPHIEDSYSRERAQDELPQSAGGKTIMTTEPKFIPNEAVEICPGEHVKMKVRMIDCVGYMVEGAQGHTENDEPRMITTPWAQTPIPFDEAAEIGTQKVISEHSTIGLLVTTDGSFTELAREQYVPAEERVVSELQAINKPFVVILNTKYPEKQETKDLCIYLEERYQVPVLPVDCASATEEEIYTIMQSVLFQFPVREITIDMPGWIDVLDDAHWLKNGLYDCVKESIGRVAKINDLYTFNAEISEYEHIENANIHEIDLGTGTACIKVTVTEALFYRVVKETSGFDIDGEDKLMSLLAELAQVKKKYDKIAYALNEVEQKGYGIVTPSIDELRLEEPEIVKQGSRFGVKLKASAPSIHMICNKPKFLKTA
ncbi:MAG: stage IV sporulation protein A [Ruminococcaceae bacterium]|nr:stage IV sporulation protein A [Oscillospiraceae bacterium]